MNSIITLKEKNEKKEPIQVTHEHSTTKCLTIFPPPGAGRLGSKGKECKQSLTLFSSLAYGHGMGKTILKLSWMQY